MAAACTILRAYTYPALHRSFVHRVFSFFSFMLSSFWLGLKVRQVDLVWGTSPPIFQGVTAWALARLKACPFPVRSARSVAGFCHRGGRAAQPAADPALRMAGALSCTATPTG